MYKAIIWPMPEIYVRWAYNYEIFVIEVLAASDADAEEERVAADSTNRSSSSVS